MVDFQKLLVLLLWLLAPNNGILGLGWKVFGEINIYCGWKVWAEMG